LVVEEIFMGMFDDAMKNSVPGGDLTTPIAIAAGAMLLKYMFGGSSAPTPTPTPRAPAPIPTSYSLPGGGAASGGGLLDGLSSIIGKLSQAGVAPQVNSWVGPGANQPIQPGQLGGALGDQTINDLIAKTGLTKEQLLAGLSAVLPQLINNMTPKGRLPTLAELEDSSR
jgi:uncharacterized protein YidB (DUF937 family)